MSQCVPSWDLDDNSTPPKFSLRSNSNSIFGAPDTPMFGYEVAELTWENGQLAMHGLCPPRVPAKPTSPSKYTWEKPRAGGTLESIVSQATRFPGNKPISDNVGLEELVPWSDNNNNNNNDKHRRRHGLLPRAAASSSATMTMDALVPCSNQTENLSSPAAATDLPVKARALGTCLVGCSTLVGSSATGDEDDRLRTEKRGRVARVAPPSRDQSASGASATNTFGRDSQHVTLDTCHKDFGFTSTSFGSGENNSTGKHRTATGGGDNENDDSVCHSRPLQREAGDKEERKKGIGGKSSASTKRSRAAAIHNQSERKRRDKINQRMKTLQKMVPNSSKTDKASMLDEVIDYLKQLQAQVQMMGRMNIQSMMLPMAIQQQLQMSMMNPMSFAMAMGMGMGVMDMSTIARPNVTSIPPVLHPTAFMPLASWEGSAGLPTTSTTVMPDPFSAFLACQSQPITMDAYSRMAAMYQQLQQQQQQQFTPNFKS